VRKVQGGYDSRLGHLGIHELAIESLIKSSFKTSWPKAYSKPLMYGRPILSGLGLEHDVHMRTQIVSYVVQRSYLQKLLIRRTDVLTYRRMHGHCTIIVQLHYFLVLSGVSGTYLLHHMTTNWYSGSHYHGTCKTGTES
jgi:hypothetical protein